MTSEPIVGVLGVVPGVGVGKSRRAIPRNHTVMESHKPHGTPRARLDELDRRFPLRRRAFHEIMPAKSRINPWFNPVRVAAGNESKPNSRGVGVPNKQKRPGTHLGSGVR